MAIIKAGILSKVSGKVAGVVGGTWKGKNYLRELVKPANPNTALQQAQRGKMGMVVGVARQLVGDILNPYLNKFCKEMSGYNWFCKENISNANPTTQKFTAPFVLTFGTMATGKLEDSTLANQDGIDFEAVPSVPAGHSLKLITCYISEDGLVRGITTTDSPTDGQVYGGDPKDISDFAGKKVRGYAFFADIDANGVLQAISSSVYTDEVTVSA